eukprot:g14233.t1
MTPSSNLQKPRNNSAGLNGKLELSPSPNPSPNPIPNPIPIPIPIPILFHFYPILLFVSEKLNNSAGLNGKLELSPSPNPSPIPNPIPIPIPIPILFHFYPILLFMPVVEYPDSWFKQAANWLGWGCDVCGSLDHETQDHPRLPAAHLPSLSIVSGFVLVYRPRTLRASVYSNFHDVLAVDRIQRVFLRQEVGGEDRA